MNEHFDKICRGEDLYALSIAQLLAKDHQVSCFGYHQYQDQKNWGRTKPMRLSSGITLIHEKEPEAAYDQEWDVIFAISNYVFVENYVEHWKKLKSRLRVVGLFSRGWDRSFIESLGGRPSDILVWAGAADQPTAPGVELLCIPFGEPAASRFDNNKVLFTAKFNITPENSNWLDAAAGFAAKKQFDFSCLQPKESGILDKDPRFDLAGKHVVKKRNVFRQLLQDYSVVWPLKEAGSVMDAVFYGIVPVLPIDWLSGYIGQPVLDQIGLGLSKDLTVDQIAAETDRLLTDREYFAVRVALLQHELRAHTDAAVRAQFELIVNKYG